MLNEYFVELFVCFLDKVFIVQEESVPLLIDPFLFDFGNSDCLCVYEPEVFSLSHKLYHQSQDQVDHVTVENYEEYSENEALRVHFFESATFSLKLTQLLKTKETGYDLIHVQK